MRQRRSVLDDGDALALDVASDQGQRGARQNDLRPRVHGGDVGPNLGDLLRRGRVDLVDYHDVGHADVGLAGVVVHLVAGSERIGNDDVQIRNVEREVVVAALPDNDIGLGLGRAQDGLVVHAGEHDAAGVEVRFVFLALLDRGLIAVEIRVGGVALDPLGDEIPVRHRVAHDGDLEALLLEKCGQVTRGLALAGAGASRAGRENRLRALDHRARRAEKLEVGPAGHRPAGRMHDQLVADIAVGEHDQIGLLLGDHLLEVRLGHDRDAVRVERSGQLGGIAAIGDAGDLGGGSGEGHDFVARVRSIDDIEVMEVATCRPHDHNTLAIHGFVRPSQSRRWGCTGCDLWG